MCFSHFALFHKTLHRLGGELRIFFIDLPSTWEITIDIDAIGTVWDHDHYITTDYEGGLELYSEPAVFHASDFSWDDQGYEPVLSLGYYKITINDAGAYFNFDMRTSDLPQASNMGTIDVEFDFSYNTNEIRHRGESKDITGEDINIWDLKDFVLHIITDLEPYPV